VLSTRIFTWSAVRLVMAGLIVILAVPHSDAALAPSGSSRWYYHIGGADAVMPALNRGVTSVTLSAGGDLGLGLNCQGFNPTLGFTTAIGEITHNLKAVITHAGAAALGALPALIIQRANPGLYELYQQIVGYANAALGLATKSCEQMQADIAQGHNPFDHWLTVSKSYTWKNQAGQSQSGHQNVDVLKALGVVEYTQDKQGVPWLEGAKAGGDPGSTGQAPIRVVSDVVTAGYNLALGRAPLDSRATSPAQQDQTRVAQVWKQPSEAAAFAVEVLGDIRIQSGAPAATPGHGLAPRIERDRRTMAEALAKLVSGETQPSPAELAKVSAPGTQLTREVLEALRKLPEGDRAVAVGKLAGEAATAVNVEKALMVRRLLLAGYQEPHVYASPAGQDIQRLVGVIDREIDQLLYETRLRKELFAGTAGTLLDVGQSLDARGGPAFRPGDARPVIDSGVKQ
jgi:integrating conjugative element protein (TIGR03755 family)